MWILSGLNFNAQIPSLRLPLRTQEKKQTNLKKKKVLVFASQKSCFVNFLNTEALGKNGVTSPN